MSDDHNLDAAATDQGSLLLSIESSCDETAAAVVANRSEVLSNILFCQPDIHAKYGGVVPEVANKAHVTMRTPLVAEAMRQAGVSPG